MRRSLINATAICTVGCSVLLLGEAEAQTPSPCAQCTCTGDRDGDGSVTIEEIIAAVNNALLGCPLSCVEAPSGLVSWWPGDGNATDSVDGNPGTLQGAVTFVSGKVDETFALDGVSDYVSIGNPSNLRFGATNDFSVDAWVNFASLVSPEGSLSQPCTTSGCDMSVVTKMVSTSPDPLRGQNLDGWRLLKQQDNHLWFCLGASSNGCGSGFPTTVRSTTVVVPGTWYHVTGVRSSSEIAIYVNGALEDSKLLPPYVNTDAPELFIGFYPQLQSLMNGLIDEVHIYHRALTAAEIADIFRADSAGVCK
jgi:hypothetical protein